MSTTEPWKFDEQGKDRYAEEILKRWERDELDDGELDLLLLMLELADEDGNVVIPEEVL
ncbi:hypothetical protein ACTXKE_02675 [Brachybacterium alimentarium]|uniref:hypothetical protein n=1 Tax=Brachybacterium alimentarium TaxID=47845 RepID=UPI003FD4F6D6